MGLGSWSFDVYHERVLIWHVGQRLAAQFAYIVATSNNYRTVRYVAPVNISMSCGLAVYCAVFPFLRRWFHASHTNPAPWFVARRLRTIRRQIALARYGCLISLALLIFRNTHRAACRLRCVQLGAANWHKVADLLAKRLPTGNERLPVWQYRHRFADAGGAQTTGLCPGQV